MATTDSLLARIRQFSGKTEKHSIEVVPFFDLLKDIVNKIKETITGSSISMLYRPDVNSMAELSALENPQKGWAVAVLNETDENTNPYIYQYDGQQWNRTPFTKLNGYSLLAVPAALNDWSALFTLQPKSFMVFALLATAANRPAGLPAGNYTVLRAGSDPGSSTMALFAQNKSDYKTYSITGKKIGDCVVKLLSPEGAYLPLSGGSLSGSLGVDGDLNVGHNLNVEWILNAYRARVLAEFTVECPSFFHSDIRSYGRIVSSEGFFVNRKGPTYEPVALASDIPDVSRSVSFGLDANGASTNPAELMILSGEKDGSMSWMYLDAYSFSVMPIESISLWTEMQSRLQIGHDVSMNVPYGCIFLNSDNGTAYLNGSEIATINQIPDVTVFPVNGENDSDIEMTRYGAGISSHIMLRPNGAYIQSHDSSTDSYSSVETHPTGGVRIVAEGSMKALYNNSEILTLASGDSRYLYYGYGNAGGSIALDDDLYFVVDSGTGKHRAAQIRKDAIAFVTHNDEWGVDNAIELIDSGIFLSDQVGQCHIAVRKNGNIHLNTTDGTAYYNNSEILTESSGLHYGQDNAGGEIVVENSLDLGINSDAGKHRTIQFRKHCIAITTHNDEWHVDNAISVDDGGIGLFDLVGQNEISIYRNGNIYIGTPDGKAYYNNNEIATVNLFAALEARITALESTT